MRVLAIGLAWVGIYCAVAWLGVFLERQPVIFVRVLGFVLRWAGLVLAALSLLYLPKAMSQARALEQASSDLPNGPLGAVTLSQLQHLQDRRWLSVFHALPCCGLVAAATLLGLHLTLAASIVYGVSGIWFVSQESRSPIGAPYSSAPVLALLVALSVWPVRLLMTFKEIRSILQTRFRAMTERGHAQEFAALPAAMTSLVEAQPSASSWIVYDRLVAGSGRHLGRPFDLMIILRPNGSIELK